MITEVSTVMFRRKLGEMLGKIRSGNDSIVISKHGRPIAALIDAALFARIRRQQERFDALAARMADDFAGTPQDDGMAAIDRACRRD